MYIAGNEITVRWILEPTDSPVAEGDYDIVFVNPLTPEGTYTDGGIVNYNAPTSTHAGSLEYLFTPGSVGLYEIELTVGTGASTVIVNRKRFWVFAEAPTTLPSTEIYGALSYASPAIVKTTTFDFELGWYLVNAITQDPVNQNLLYVVGRDEFADSNGSIAVLDTTTKQVVSVNETIPFTDISGVSVNNTGRVVAQKTNTESGFYECYYSDNLTSWTKCTRSGYTASAPQGMMWDPFFEVFFWLTNATLGVSLDGITFYLQQIDWGDNDGSAGNFNCSYIRRIELAADSILHGGAITLGGGGERIWTNIDNDVPVSGPLAWQDFNGNSDIYGSGYASQDPIEVARDLTGNTLWLVEQGGLLIESGTDGISFSDGDIVDVSGVVEGSIVYFFTIDDFSKMFIVSVDTGVWKIYESDDGTVWSVSSDPRFSGYTWTNSPFNRSTAWNYMDGSGIAFKHVPGLNDETVVAVV